jgi:hypothetical protein
MKSDVRFKCCYCNIECDRVKDYWYCDICDMKWTDGYYPIKDENENWKKRKHDS